MNNGFAGIVILNRHIAAIKLSSAYNATRVAILVAKAREVRGNVDILKSVPGVELDDQGTIGPLSSALVEMSLMDRPEHAMLVAQALRIVLKADYFWIIGEPKDNGMKTKIERIVANSAEEAEAKFRSIPEVLLTEVGKLLRS